MLNANAGNSGKTQLLGRLDANHAIQDGIATSDQHGIAKAELGDRGCDFTNRYIFEPQPAAIWRMSVEVAPSPPSRMWEGRRAPFSFRTGQ